MASIGPILYLGNSFLPKVIQPDYEKKLALLKQVKEDGLALEHAPEKLKNDREIVLAAVWENGTALKYASKNLRNDREIVVAAVRKNGTALKYASKNLRNDRGIVIVAVWENGTALKYASEELKNDREIVLAALTKNFRALKYASEELKNDREIVFNIVCENGLALKYASEELKNDRQLVFAAVDENGLALKYASEELKNNRTIVFAAVKNNGLALKYASQKKRNNSLYFFVAVSENALALKYGSKNLRKDRKIFIAALEKNYKLLKYASENFKNDREIVFAAVRKKGTALKYASENLRNDREIVVAAVNNDGYALKYASENLRNDLEIVFTAVRWNSRALEYASDELRYDPEIIHFTFWNENLISQNAFALLRGEFQDPDFPSILAELYIRHKFKGALTNQKLKELQLRAFPYSLQPAITDWLERLTDTIMFENARSASILANQVYAIFAYAKENPEFFGKLEEELQNAQMSCSDSSLVIYHTLSTAKKLMEVFTKPLPEIIQLCRGLYKLSLLETQAFKQFQEFGGDQISISLGLQAKLCDELSLPLDFNEVRFDHNRLGLTEEAVTTAREFVIQSLNNPEGFIQYFSQLEPWQKHLLATNETVKAKHTEITDLFAERLEELMDKAGTMTDIEYKTQIDAMVIERTLAFKKLFEDATLHILETTSPSQAASSSGVESSSRVNHSDRDRDGWRDRDRGGWGNNSGGPRRPRREF